MSRYIRLHRYGSVQHIMNDDGTIMCGRSIPADAIESDEPRSPNGYICPRCYRVEKGMDPPPMMRVAEPNQVTDMEERLAAIEVKIGLLFARPAVSVPTEGEPKP